jgi:adenylate cyclase
LLPCPSPTACATQGLSPRINEQARLNKSLLIFATGLFCFGSMTWLTLYAIIGPQIPTTWPFSFELILVANLLLYIKNGNFDFFPCQPINFFSVRAVRNAVGDR